MTATATTTGKPVLTPQMRAEIEAFFPRYPTKQAVTLPALHIVNEQLRCVPLEAVVEIAAMLELAPAVVYDTLSFYGFFKPRRAARCGPGCAARSVARCAAAKKCSALSDKLGVHPGETTSDGRITLEFGECLGLCDFAPAMLAGTHKKDCTKI